MSPVANEADATGPFRIHLLDVGPEKFGDCILCEIGSKVILIDGSHPGDYRPREGFPSIPDQLAQLLGHAAPFALDLLICTHAHVDHIGCLPKLVHDQTIRPKFAILADPILGWGRSGEDAAFDAGIPDAARPIVAALREESRADVTDGELRQFLADAGGLEANYKQMFADLQSQNVTIARYGRDDQAVAAIVNKFKSVGLKIFGPTQEQLLLCAEVIRQQGRDAGGDAAAMMAGGMDPLQAYRLSAAADAASDGGSVGAALNDQSIILRFNYKGAKALLTGDMQFVKPQVTGVADLLKPMLQAIAADGPYGFVKLGHHASNNAVGDDVLDAYDAPWLGISTGRNGADHPNAAVLKILNARKAKSSWLRTDKNGLVTFELSGNNVTATRTRGKINDATPKSADQPIAIGGEGAISPIVPITGNSPQAGVATQSWSAGDGVEILVRIPHGTKLDVSLTLSLSANKSDGAIPQAAAPSVAPPAPALSGPSPNAVHLAGGRKLPPLLFVTSAQALRRNLGVSAADACIAAIRASGQQLVDDIAVSADVVAAARTVRARLVQHRDLRGVVIVGGYDVVPSAPVDALDPHLRRDVEDEGFSDKEDNFFVWNDDLYGDVDDDGMPELAVSRIPDARSPELLRAGLGAAPASQSGARFGIRNVARPFAEDVFSLLPGGEKIMVSRPTTSGDVPAGATRASRNYFMLHGDYSAPGEFSGEDDGDYPVAFGTQNVGAQCGEVVYTGCCWGGLSIDRLASQFLAGQPFEPRKVGESIALTFLRNGSLAFIGCTGMHYSPLQKPYRHHGGRMHTYFWDQIGKGTPPAQALFNAKAAYVREIPVEYGQPIAPSDIAIERKIWRQYTCLGLGW